MLEEILEEYPKRIELKDGSPCSIRLPQATDEAMFCAFHRVLPEREQLFVHNQIRDGSLFRQWTADTSFESNLPLLALVDGQLTAMAILRQRPGGWKRHIGRVSFLTHPDYHGKGLIDALLDEMVTAARHSGLIKLESELNGERASAIESMVAAGFEELVRLPNYVQDMQAESHDYVLMGIHLIPDYEDLGVGD